MSHGNSQSTCSYGSDSAPDTKAESTLPDSAPAATRDVSQNQYRHGVEAAPTGLLMVDSGGLITMVNQRLEAMFGYNRTELLGKRIEVLIPRRMQAAHPALLQGFLDNPKARFMGQGTDLTGARKDGSEMAIEIGLNPFVEGGKRYVLASIVDVTERKIQQEELKSRVEELQGYRYEMGLLSEMSSLLQHAVSSDEAHNIVSIFGQKLIRSDDYVASVSVFLVRASRDGLERKAHWGTGEAVPRFSPEECWGLRRLQTHYSGDDGENPAFPRCSHAKEDGWHMCIPMSAHGQSIGLICMAGPGSLAGAERGSLERVGKSIADQLALAVSNLNLRESLSALAVRDPLTSLFNRRHMEASVNREVARAKRDDTPLSVIMLDIDHFKVFNDTHGHQAADQVLVELGARLKSHFRESDIPCRYGGEEFLIVLPACPKHEAQVLAERFRDLVEKSALGITVSVGVATMPVDGHNWDIVLRKADSALYEAKAAGRNQVRLAESPANNGGAPSVTAGAAAGS
ncbi:MAG: diguanylate cyclase [Nannocystaceae bacterium]|nr:diguanylate cyclase [Nannocystaceae bacterium]